MLRIFYGVLMMQRCTFESKSYSLPQDVVTVIDQLQPKKWVERVITKDPRYELLVSLYTSLFSQKEEVRELFATVAPQAIALFKKRQALKMASQKAQQHISLILSEWKRGTHKMQAVKPQLTFARIPKDIVLEILQYLRPQEYYHLLLVEKCISTLPVENVCAINQSITRLFMEKKYLTVSKEMQNSLCQKLNVLHWSITDAEGHKTFMEKILQFFKLTTLYLSTNQYALDEVTETCAKLPHLMKCVINGGPFLIAVRGIYPHQEPVIGNLQVEFQSLAFKTDPSGSLSGQIACFLISQQKRCTLLRELSFDGISFSETATLLQFPTINSVEKLSFTRCYDLHHIAVVLLLKDKFPSVQSLCFIDAKESLPKELLETFSSTLVEIGCRNCQYISVFPTVKSTLLQKVRVTSCPEFGNEGLASLAQFSSIHTIHLSRLPQLISAKNLLLFPKNQLKEVILPITCILSKKDEKKLKERQPNLQLKWIDDNSVTQAFEQLHITV